MGQVPSSHQELISKLPVNNSERQKQLYKLGHEAKPETLEPLLKDLEQSGNAEYLLIAIRIAIAAKDTKRILQYLQHDLVSVRDAAVNGVRHLSDEQVKDVLFKVVPRVRRQILKFIRGRKNLLKELIKNVYEKYGLNEAMLLVPYLKDTKDVKSLVEEMKLKMKKLYHWKPLSKRHPEVVLELIKDEVKQEKPKGKVLEIWGKYDAPMKKILPKIPKQVVQAVKESLPEGNFLPNYVANFPFSSKNPDLFVDLVTSEELLTTRSVRYVIVRFPKNKDPLFYYQVEHFGRSRKSVQTLTADHLMKIWTVFSKHCDEEYTWAVFGGIIQKLNKKVLEEFIKKLIDTLGIDNLAARLQPHISDNIAYLSKELRIKIVKKQLEEAQRTKKLTQRDMLPYLKYMDIKEVRKQIVALVSDSDPNNRSQAYNALVICSTIGGEIPETLKFLEKRFTHEQDSVKIDFINLLLYSKYKQIIRDENHMESLQRIIDSMFQAQDRSSALLSSITRFASRLIHRFSIDSKQFKLGLHIFRQFFEQIHESYSPSHLSHCSEEVKYKVIETVKDLILKDIEQERLTKLNQLRTLLHCYNDRKPHPGFEELLSKAFVKPFTGKDILHQLKPLIRFWLYSKEKRRERLQKIIELYPTAIADPSVENLLFSSEQDLLAPYLAIGTLLSVNNIPGKQPIDPLYFKSNFCFSCSTISKYYYRLPFLQRKQLSQMIKAAIDDDTSLQNVRQKNMFLITLVKLQNGINDEKITKYIQSFYEHKDAARRTMAFGSKMYSDNPKNAFVELLKGISAENAKIVGSALHRCSQQMNTSEVLKILSDTLLSEEFNKKGPSVQKEVLRVLLSYPTKETVSIIQKKWKLKNHVDVRAIVARVATSLLEVDEAIWSIMEEAAVDDYKNTVLSLFNVKKDKYSDATYKRLSTLQLKALDSKDQEITEEAWKSIWIDFGTEVQVASKAISLLEDFSEKSNSFTLEPTLISKLVKCCISDPTKSVSEKIYAFVKKLLTEYKKVEEQYNATTTWDLPVRKRLSVLCKELSGKAYTFFAANKQDLLQKIGETIIDQDETVWSYGIDVLFSVTNWKNAESILNTLKHIESVIQKKKLDPIFYAQETVSCVKNNFIFNKQGVNTDAVQQVVKEICDPKKKYSPAMNIIGIELLNYVGKQSSVIMGEKYVWSEPLREVLKQLRQHPSGPVRHRALKISCITTHRGYD